MFRCVLFFLLTCCAYSHIQAEFPEFGSKIAVADPKPEPVTLKAGQIKAVSLTKSTLVLRLQLAPKIEIYAQQPKENENLYFPLNITLLDGKDQPVKCEVRYPKPELIESVLGPYAAFRKSFSARLTFETADQPIRVVAKYQGYSNVGY